MLHLHLLHLLLALILGDHRELLREKHGPRVAEAVAGELLVRTVELLGVLALVEPSHLHQHLGEAVTVGPRLAIGTAAAASSSAAAAAAAAAPVLVLVRFDDIVDDRVGVLLRAMNVGHAGLPLQLLLAPSAALDVVILVRLRGRGMGGGGGSGPIRRCSSRVEAIA